MLFGLLLSPRQGILVSTLEEEPLEPVAGPRASMDSWTTYSSLRCIRGLAGVEEPLWQLRRVFRDVKAELEPEGTATIQAADGVRVVFSDTGQLCTHAGARHVAPRDRGSGQGAHGAHGKGI